MKGKIKEKINILASIHDFPSEMFDEAKRLKILIIDDEIDYLELIERYVFILLLRLRYLRTRNKPIAELLHDFSFALQHFLGLSWSQKALFSWLMNTTATG